MEPTVRAAVYADGSIHRIARQTEADALVGWTAATKHREARRGAAGRDHVLGVALGPGRVDLDVVAGAGRNVLDIEARHHRAAPLGSGMTGDFRQRGRSGTGQ